MNTPRTTATDNQDHATQVIAEYMRRVDAGENVNREQFLRQNPDVAQELDRFLDNVALVEQMAGPIVGKQPQSPGDAGPLEQARQETVAGTQSGDSVPENNGNAAGNLKSGKFGRYRVEKTLGEGAMGTGAARWRLALCTSARSLGLPLQGLPNQPQYLSRFSRC